MSTWLRRHATHIFAGFGSISVPHSQHKLQFLEIVHFRRNYLLFLFHKHNQTLFLIFNIFYKVFVVRRLIILTFWIQQLDFPV